MNEGKTDGRPAGLALVAAVIVLAAWLVLLTYMAFHTGTTEMQWARLGSVLGSLEAVAFAAAGAIFGTAVQKQRVDDANQRAGEEAQRASQAEAMSNKNAQAAANGRVLAEVVKTRARTHGTVLGIKGGIESGETMDDLAALAAKLFPD